jgi:hypothetical protein
MSDEFGDRHPAPPEAHELSKEILDLSLDYADTDGLEGVDLVWALLKASINICVMHTDNERQTMLDAVELFQSMIEAFPDAVIQSVRDMKKEAMIGKTVGNA